MRKAILFIMFMPFISVAENCNFGHQDLFKKHASILQLYKTLPHRASNELNELEKEITKRLKECERPARLNTLMAQVQMSLSKNKLALKHARNAIYLDPNSADTNQIYDSLLTIDINRGIAYLEKSVTLAPLDMQLTLNLCSTYEMDHEYNQAVESCSIVINSNQESLKGPAHYIRGRAYHYLKKEKQSKQDFDKAKELGFEGNLTN